MIRNIMVLLLITGILAGCAMSSQNLNAVKLGMQKSEVIQAMGAPAYTAARGDVEILTYKLRAHSLLTEEYVVRIKNGQVDLFGKRYDFGSLY